LLAAPEVAMIVSVASTEDKLRYLERLKALLDENAEVEQSSIDAFFANENVFVCLYKDEIRLVDAQYISGPLKPEENKEAETP
jgi:hypothetical protein